MQYSLAAIIKTIVFLIICLLFIFSYVKYIEKKSVFFPFSDIEATPKDLHLAFEDVYFNTQDREKLNAWFISAKDSQKILLFLHGNGGNISHRLEKISLFNSLGITIFIIDYRGYGLSTGRPTEKGIYLDAQAAYEYLLRQKSKRPEDIIVYGESLGAQAAVDLASKNKLAALILEEAFTSAKDMSAAIYPFLPTIFLSIKFDSVSKIKKISCPKLIIHSRNDEIVPFRLGKKLYDVALEPKEFLELLGGHNTCVFDSHDLFVAGIKKFLAKLQ
ncbi:MAG: alpha/beta hydrolase [Candidatus Omnitrophota bacterium]